MRKRVGRVVDVENEVVDGKVRVDKLRGGELWSWAGSIGSSMVESEPK